MQLPGLRRRLGRCGGCARRCPGRDEAGEEAFDAASDRFDAAERALDAAREDRAQARRDRYAAGQQPPPISAQNGRLHRRHQLADKEEARGSSPRRPTSHFPQPLSRFPACPLTLVAETPESGPMIVAGDSPGPTGRELFLLITSHRGRCLPGGHLARGRELVPRQATFARSESSLADAITRCSVSSPTETRPVMRSREREGEGEGCVGRFLVGR